MSNYINLYCMLISQLSSLTTILGRHRLTIHACKKKNSWTNEPYVYEQQSYKSIQPSRIYIRHCQRPSKVRARRKRKLSPGPSLRSSRVKPPWTKPNWRLKPRKSRPTPIWRDWPPQETQNSLSSRNRLGNRDIYKFKPSFLFNL